MSGGRTYGRYEVAIESSVDLRRYQDFPRGQRLREMSADTTPISIDFDGRQFTWFPPTDEYLGVVATSILEQDSDLTAEREAIYRFLSVLSYEYNSAITAYSEVGSSHVREDGVPTLQQPKLKGTIFPAPAALEIENDPELRLCLALMREGLSSSSRMLRFLSLYKAIEVAVGEKRTAWWIDQNASTIIQGRQPTRSWSAQLRDVRHSAAHAIRKRAKARHYDPDDATSSVSMDHESAIFQLAKAAVESRWADAVRTIGDGR